jgi:Uma2 family endonuclease
MISMALHDRIRKLTYDDYALLPEDGRRYEIIDGELYVSPSPFIPHQELSFELSGRFWSYLKRHRLGRILAAPVDVLLSKHDIVQPDLLFISNERAGIAADNKNVKGAPDLLVEILSKSTRKLDEEIKLHLYERYDVLEYWIFDTDRRSVRAYRRSGERLLLIAELSAEAGDVLTTPLLPGLELPLSEIFSI